MQFNPNETEMMLGNAVKDIKIQPGEMFLSISLIPGVITKLYCHKLYLMEPDIQHIIKIAA